MRLFETRVLDILHCNRKTQLINYGKSQDWDISQYSIEISYNDLKAQLLRTAAYYDAQELQEKNDSQFNK